MSDRVYIETTIPSTDAVDFHAAKLFKWRQCRCLMKSLRKYGGFDMKSPAVADTTCIGSWHITANFRNN